MNQRPLGPQPSALPDCATPLPRRRLPSSDSSGSLVLGEHDDAVHDVDAEREDGQRPPGIGPADRQQCSDRTKAAEAFAAGALLTMLSSTLIPEAVRGAGREVSLLTVLGFAVAFALVQFA